MYARRVRAADNAAAFLEKALDRLGPGISIHKEEAEVALLTAQVLACNKDLEIKESAAVGAREREEAEVELLKAQALACAEEVVIKKKTAKGAKIANAGAQIANIKVIMETGSLTDDLKKACRDKIFLIGMGSN